MLNHKASMAACFSRAASSYEKHNFVQKEIASRLLSRCQLMRWEPKNILNLGSATGRFTQEIQNLYPSAHIVNLDLSIKMCEIAREKKMQVLCGDLEYLPLASNIFDLVISNCTLEWSRSLEQVFVEVKRVLNVDGRFLFATVGPDTLEELARASYEIDQLSHVNGFLDMHNLGDLLLKSGLKDTVVDREDLKIFYDDVSSILIDLKKTGSTYLFQESRSQHSKKWYDLLKSGYPVIDAQYPVTIEILYGYALKKHA